MKRFLCGALALVTAIGFSTSAWAKGGGHGGGGHHSSGHHSGHHGSHHSSHHHGHHSNHHVSHHGDHHHYAHDWHHHHGGAWGWGAGGWGWGNPWGYATLGGAAAWLGLSALDNADGGNVIVNNNAPVGNDQADDDVANDQDESAQPANAAALAAQGATEPGADAKFMPLGVYSLAPKGDKEAAGLLQLAVSKDGVLRGSFYNLKTDKCENIQGAVNKEDRSLAWTMGNNKRVFHTWLEDLTNPPTPVTVRNADGQTHVWTAARYTEEDEKRSFAEGQKQKKALGELNQ